MKDNTEEYKEWLNKRIDQSEDDFINGRYKTSTELLEKFNYKE